MKKIADMRVVKLLVPLFALLVSACGDGSHTIGEWAPPPHVRPPVWEKPSPPAHIAAPVAPAGPAGPLTVARVGSYMDALESELRRHVHGQGILVARIGDDITVVLRNDRLFSADGTLAADDILEPLGAVLRGYAHTAVAVGGFTDTVGSPERNLAISQKRAGIVASALAHEGVAAARISSQGFGETRLKVATGDDKKEPRNRRIEILLKAKPG